MRKFDLKTIHIANLEIPDYKLGKKNNGYWSFVVRNSILKKLYKRDNLCLKIFRHACEGDVRDYMWGGPKQNKSQLVESIVVQNIFHNEGLAPRIYDIVKITSDKLPFVHIGVVSEYVNGKSQAISGEFQDKMRAVAAKHDIYLSNDWNDENLINEQYVDFQGIKFNNKTRYEKNLEQKVHEVAFWGPDSSYQTIGDILGRRDTKYRIKHYGLDKYNFKGKTVLDIGCSGGVFCHYALMKDAQRVVGIDTPAIADVARELANYLGYWNIDFYGMDLGSARYKNIVKETGIENYDLVMYLAMGFHIGYPEYVNKLAKKDILFEGNQRPSDDLCIKNIKKEFKVKFMSNTEDLLDRPALWGTR